MKRHTYNSQIKGKLIGVKLRHKCSKQVCYWNARLLPDYGADWRDKKNWKLSGYFSYQLFSLYLIDQSLTGIRGDSRDFVIWRYLQVRFKSWSRSHKVLMLILMIEVRTYQLQPPSPLTTFSVLPPTPNLIDVTYAISEATLSSSSQDRLWVVTRVIIFIDPF